MDNVTSGVITESAWVGAPGVITKAAVDPTRPQRPVCLMRRTYEVVKFAASFKVTAALGVDQRRCINYGKSSLIRLYINFDCLCRCGDDGYN